MRVPELKKSAWLACLTLALGLTVSSPTQADALDTVLDVLYKAGLIDGNVKAAKPLITCLAQGNSVQDCTIGAAGQTELANDPQVRNVLDIYQAFQQHDWYGVLKKAGITVGCALIPGGEVKDVVCGELGKIAGAVLDGVGSVLGAVGNFFSSMFGGGSDPAPMTEQDYYRLNFMPWYHWSVVHQLDNDTSANLQVLNAPIASCVHYFNTHKYNTNQAVTACNNMRTNLSNSGYAIGNAFRQETDSYFQLHFAPKVQEWAEMSFNNNDNINNYAKQAMNSCMWDERLHIPLPNPGFEQCQAMQQQMATLPFMFKSAADQLYAQCQAEANQRVVPENDDAYTRICQPMTNRIIGKVIIAMAGLKSQMDSAAASGCPNYGTPKSIHCDSFMTHAACVNAMPEHASMCNFNQDKAVTGEAGLIFEAVSTANQPCQLNGKTISCVRPKQQANCRSAKQAVGDAWGPSAINGLACESLDSPAYNQLKQQATMVVAALDASYDPNEPPPPCQGAACQDQPGGQLLAPQEQAPALQLRAVSPGMLVVGEPAQGCGVRRDDPLVISCPSGFHWDANHQRAVAVYEAIGTTQVYCPSDDEHDGAEAPCLEGAPSLSPAVDQDHPPQQQQTPSLRLRRALPIIRKDGGSGG